MLYRLEWSLVRYFQVELLEAFWEVHNGCEKDIHPSNLVIIGELGLPDI